MNSIFERIAASQRSNPFLNKLATGVVTEESEKTTDLSADMATGAENIPDVTNDVSSAPIADMGTNVESAVDAPEAEIASAEKNEDNPDVQEILDAKETVVKTANALYSFASQIAAMPLDQLDAVFDKTASAVAITEEQAFNVIEKAANSGSHLAQSFLEFVDGYNFAIEKMANDTAALIEQGIPPEEAQAMAAEGLAAEMGAAPEEMAMEGAEEVPADVEQAAGAEIEAAVAEITATIAEEIMNETGASPEEAQALAEEMVAEKVEEELAAAAGEGGEEAPVEAPVEEPAGMEQTASAEDLEEAEEVAEDAIDEDDELISQLAEASEIVAQAIMEEDPEIDEETAGNIADELVVNELLNLGNEELSAGAEEVMDEPEVEGALEEVEEGDDMGSAIEQLIVETAVEIMDAVPEVGEEEAIELAQEAVADALDVVEEQEAIGATGEDGEYLVPDDVAAESVDEMLKTAAANPMRDYLAPVVADLFGVDQTAFAKRLR